MSWNTLMPTSLGPRSPSQTWNCRGPLFRLRLRLRFLRFVKSSLNPKFSKMVDREILITVVQQLEDMSSILLTNLRTLLNTCLGPKDVSAEQRNSRQRVSQDESLRVQRLLNFDSEWRWVLSIWARPVYSSGRKHTYSINWRMTYLWSSTLRYISIKECILFTRDLYHKTLYKFL